MKAVTGSTGTQAVKFYIGKIYDEAASINLNIEAHKEVELVEFMNDPRSSYVCRVKDMTTEQRIRTQPLYDRFLTQKGSDETMIEAWEILQEAEKIEMLMNGINTVEQLASFEDHDIARLGSGGKLLRDKARRHIAGKHKNDRVDQSAQMQLIAEENRKLREESEKREQDYFALQARLATLEAATVKRPGRANAQA